MDKIVMGHKITDLVANITGEYLQTANRIAVTKRQVCEAAALLGFNYNGNCTPESYHKAYAFLCKHIQENS